MCCGRGQTVILPALIDLVTGELRLAKLAIYIIVSLARPLGKCLASGGLRRSLLDNVGKVVRTGRAREYSSKAMYKVIQSFLFLGRGVFRKVGSDSVQQLPGAVADSSEISGQIRLPIAISIVWRTRQSTAGAGRQAITSSAVGLCESIGSPAVHSYGARVAECRA